MKAYKSSIFPQCVRAGLWVAVLVGPGVYADEITGISAQPSDNWSRASDSELDQLRGGFALPNGVNVDFSLDRVTYLNGALVASTSFQLPQGNGLLLQNGGLNQAPEITGSALGSVIQNNMDNQVIKNMTNINIAVSNLKNMNLDHRDMVFNNLIMPNVR